MSTCPNCGATITENTDYCENCKTPIPPQTQNTKLAAQLEKELKRTQTLSYVAAGLGIAILATLILLAFA